MTTHPPPAQHATDRATGARTIEDLRARLAREAPGARRDDIAALVADIDRLARTTYERGWLDRTEEARREQARGQEPASGCRGAA